ncbi:uncharacterized protein LOC102436648 [Myotis lucifugus]|uniref:uncharacterized protein LOC102436648 n=1 Tax=Myotis lucifugus TaxID=59463 RepID=UPI0006D73E8D|nr:uncharacterized protein LOC102436648 [Myotis lucifugus]
MSLEGLCAQGMALPAEEGQQGTRAVSPQAAAGSWAGAWRAPGSLRGSSRNRPLRCFLSLQDQALCNWSSLEASSGAAQPSHEEKPAQLPACGLDTAPGTVLMATGSESQGSEHRTGLQGADTHPKTPLLLSSIRSLSESSRCRSRASSECAPASRRAQGMSAGVAERSPNREWPSAWKRRSLVKETSPETSARHAKTIELFQDPRSHLQTL